MIPEKPGFKSLTEVRECLRRRCLLRQSVPDTGSCNHERPVTDCIGIRLLYERQVYKQCRNLINTNQNNTQTHNFNKGATEYKVNIYKFHD